MIKVGVAALILALLFTTLEAKGAGVKVLGVDGKEFLLLESIVEQQRPQSMMDVVSPQAIVTKECASCTCCIGTGSNCKKKCCYLRNCPAQTLPCTFTTLSCGCDNCP
ncbi:hypothetical protein ACP4OV_028428 [Aristida adscensionis]